MSAPTVSSPIAISDIPTAGVDIVRLALRYFANGIIPPAAGGLPAAQPSTIPVAGTTAIAAIPSVSATAIRLALTAQNGALPHAGHPLPVTAAEPPAAQFPQAAKPAPAVSVVTSPAATLSIVRSHAAIAGLLRADAYLQLVEKHYRWSPNGPAVTAAGSTHSAIASAAAAITMQALPLRQLGANAAPVPTTAIGASGQAVPPQAKGLSGGPVIPAAPVPTVESGAVAGSDPRPAVAKAFSAKAPAEGEPAARFGATESAIRTVMAAARVTTGDVAGIARAMIAQERTALATTLSHLLGDLAVIDPHPAPLREGVTPRTLASSVATALRVPIEPVAGVPAASVTLRSAPAGVETHGDRQSPERSSPALVSLVLNGLQEDRPHLISLLSAEGQRLETPEQPGPRIAAAGLERPVPPPVLPEAMAGLASTASQRLREAARRPGDKRKQDGRKGRRNRPGADGTPKFNPFL